MNNSTVYMGAIEYELGESVPIDQYYPLRGDLETIKHFKKNGLENIAVSPIDPNLLALRSCKKTLKSTNLSGSDIDAVIYASTSNWNPAFSKENSINWLLNELEVTNGFPMGIYLPGCANFSIALRVAKNLIIGDGLKHVLIVTSDKTDPKDPENRIFYPDITLLSDAAASCIVSSVDEFDYIVKDVQHHSAPHMWDLDMEKNFSAFLLETVRGTETAVNKLFSNIDEKKEDIKLLILNNFNLSTMRMIAKQIGFRDDVVYMDNLMRFAHAFTADNLINFIDAEKSKNFPSGSLFLLLAAGAKNWGLILIEKK